MVVELRAAGGHCEDRRDDEVDRNHVDRALRDAGELDFSRPRA